MTKLEEKRASKRIQPAARRKVQIYSRQGIVHYAHFAEVVNLSVGGICVKSAREFPPGEQLQMFLRSREIDQSLKTEGEVIWKQPAGKYAFQLGVKFITNHRKRHIMQEKLKDIMAAYDSRSTMLSRLFG
ncbi:PilZ domain-containing protein [bacterium]|nr:PilZ domain-containing protein [bacterium]